MLLDNKNNFSYTNFDITSGAKYTKDYADRAKFFESKLQGLPSLVNGHKSSLDMGQDRL